MIRLEHAVKQYPGFQLYCSMEVKEGQITALLGANGAGKSTTFKLILGLCRADSGDVMVFGHPVEELTLEERQKIGVVFADAGFSEYLTIQDLVPVLVSLYPAFRKDRFLKYCKQFSLPLNKKIKDFSNGMKAKLKVVTAICNEAARLLIMDEPTAGMDVMAREELLDLIREFMIPGDRSVLISSHISSDLETLCDDFYLINEGRIILHEQTDVLLDQYGILKVTPEQYETLDKEWILKVRKESYGYNCLTGQKQYYMENWPQIVVENATIDQLLIMLGREDTQE